MRRKSEEEKAEILEGYKRSGLSLWKYTRRENLNYQTVERWVGDKSRKSTSALGLVAVELTDKDVDQEVSRGATVVRLPQGVEVIFEGGEDVGKIARFCREVVGC